MAENHNCGLAKSNLAILKSSAYADMTVRCDSTEFKLHRAIVCPRSKFFAAACDGQFQEARDCNIVLVEDDLPTVRRMLNYLYALDYDDDGPPASAQHYMVDGTKPTTSQDATTTTTPHLSEESLRHTNKLMNNVVVYAIAQKYGIDELKELATAKFEHLLWLEAPNHGFPDVIASVYETSSMTDQRLRLVAAGYCALYSTEILADDHLCGVIKDHSDLGLDVLREVSENSARNLHQKRGLREQLVKLKGELAHVVGRASKVEKSRQIHSSVTAVLQELKTIYNNLEIESDEEAGDGEGEEGGEAWWGDENE